MEAIIVIACVIALVVWHAAYKTKKRREALMLKYGDEEIVEGIMRRAFWQGQTQEQLVDSLGNPVDIDNKVYKTKTKKTFKYNQTGKNRYGLKILLEDGLVVGWEKK